MTPHGSPAATPEFRKPDATTALAVALGIGLGVVWPLADGVSGAALALMELAALVLCFGVTYLPSRLRVPGFVVVLVVGAMVVGIDDRRLSQAWLGLVIASAMIALAVRWTMQSRSGAPRPAKASGPRMTWDEKGSRREVSNVSPDDAVAAVRALDGHERTFVSLFRGEGRLDVGGEAGAAMVVFCSDDRRQWHQVVTSDAGEAETAVTVGGLAGRYPRHETTDLASAETAVRGWLGDGRRDPALTWRAATREHDVVRPPALEADD